jgi:hypothetical protein
MSSKSSKVTHAANEAHAEGERGASTFTDIAPQNAPSARSTTKAFL